MLKRQFFFWISNFLNGVFVSQNWIISAIFSQIRYNCPQKVDVFLVKMGIIFDFSFKKFQVYLSVYTYTLIQLPHSCPNIKVCFIESLFYWNKKLLVIASWWGSLITYLPICSARWTSTSLSHNTFVSLCSNNLHEAGL